MAVLKHKEVNGVDVMLIDDTGYGNYAVVEKMTGTELNRTETIDYEDAITIYNEK